MGHRLKGDGKERDAHGHCQQAQAAEFRKAVAQLELQNLKRVEGELEFFTLKFDYRYADKPWGNSKDAPERAINKLMGACVGEEARLPPHND